MHAPTHVIQYVTKYSYKIVKTNLNAYPNHWYPNDDTNYWKNARVEGSTVKQQATRCYVATDDSPCSSLWRQAQNPHSH